MRHRTIASLKECQIPHLSSQCGYTSVYLENRITARELAFLMQRSPAEHTLEPWTSIASTMRFHSDTCWRAFPARAVATAIEHPDSPEVLATYVGCASSGDSHVPQLDGAQLSIIYCVAGSGRVRIGDRQYELRAGQILVLPPGEVCDYRSHSDDPWKVYRIHLAGRRARSVLRLLTDNEKCSIFTIGHDPSTIEALEAIYDSMRGHESTHLLMTFLATAKLVWRLAEKSVQPSNPLNKDQRVHATLQFMLQRLESGVSVGELAAMAHLSRSRYAQVFKRQMGYSVLEYLIRTKMHRAADLLENTDEQVKKIASGLGFRDPLYFSRQFRRVHGVYPTAFRSIVRQFSANFEGFQA